MKIYTRTGDKGLSSLIGGKRVTKDHIKLEAYGTLDELNCWIGSLAGHFSVKKTNSVLLKDIQSELFLYGSWLALSQYKLSETYQIPKPDKKLSTRVESAIDQMDLRLPVLKSFILPGGTRLAIEIHIARTITRRAERVVVKVANIEKNKELKAVYIEIIKNLNRFSDYFFTLSRFINFEAKKKGN